MCAYVATLQELQLIIVQVRATCCSNPGVIYRMHNYLVDAHIIYVLASYPLHRRVLDQII